VLFSVPFISHVSTATTGPGLVFLVNFFSSEIEQKRALVRRRQVASALTPQQQTPSVLDAPRYPAPILPAHAVARPLSHLYVPVWGKIADKLALEENPKLMNLKTAGSAEATTHKLQCCPMRICDAVERAVECELFFLASCGGRRPSLRAR
jgi:hypothetical protein